MAFNKLGGFEGQLKIHAGESLTKSYLRRFKGAA